MEFIKKVFFVFGLFVLVGIFILGCFVILEDRRFVYIVFIIKRNIVINIQVMLFIVKNGFRDIIILWYNIFFYLRLYVKYFKMKKCENVRLNCVVLMDNFDFYKSSVVIFIYLFLLGFFFMKFKFQIWMFNFLENKVYIQRFSFVWKNKFDWIMFYCRDVDVLRFYGKIIRLDKSIERNYFEVFCQKIKFGVWMFGYCFVLFCCKEYIEKLQKYIDIDMFGLCGKKKCGI